MFGTNLIQLRKMNRMTQEDVAARLGVSRQAVAKWEAGESLPDIQTGQKLADLFNVSLDELVHHEQENAGGLFVAPKGKHMFGVVTVGEKGQIIIPAKARKIFDISPGDQLIVLGDEGQGLAIIKSGSFLQLADMVRQQMLRKKTESNE